MGHLCRAELIDCDYYAASPFTVNIQALAASILNSLCAQTCTIANTLSREIRRSTNIEASRIIMSKIIIFFSSIISRILLILLIICLKAVNAIDNLRVEHFTSLKSIDGDDVCAVDISPVMSNVVWSKMQCNSECTKHGYYAY